MDTLPLSGYRIIEVCEIWAGPFAGCLLGDLGAQVVKVEAIQRHYRGPLRPTAGRDYPDGQPGERPWNRNANFNALARNKLSVTLDLAHPRGLALLKDLARVSDAVVTNLAGGVPEALGITYESLQAARADIIYLAMPGFGETGPYRRYRSMGMTIDAITGHTALRGYPDEDLSTNSPVHHGDAVAGATAAFAVVAALWHRANTGMGQFIDLAQAEATIPHLGEIYLDWEMNRRNPRRWANRHPSMAPHGCYPCKSGDGPIRDRWITIACPSDQVFARLCQVIGRPDLGRDTSFADLLSRLEHREELDAAIQAWTTTQEAHDAMTLLAAAGVPAGVVLDGGHGLRSDPHLRARGSFELVTHPEAGSFPMAGPPWKLTETQVPTQTPPPCLGEHNGYILSELLGLTGADLQELEAQQVIGTIPLEGSDTGGVRRAQRTRAL
ncbi:MAG: CoA transferase [Chloroflexi bacterium]|nr:CoA transferase [Chloroflexota bacterium]